MALVAILNGNAKKMDGHKGHPYITFVRIICIHVKKIFPALISTHLQ
jgi:hypothetical protein